jgi:hypothetical protein
MGIPGLSASLSARVKGGLQGVHGAMEGMRNGLFEGSLDGASGLLSYLLFTSLQRHAPALGRSADRLGKRLRRSRWLVGRAETTDGPLDIAYLGSPDRLSLWLLDRLGVVHPHVVRAKQVPGSVPCAVELSLVPADERGDWARAGWLVLPRYVHHRQMLSGDPSAFEKRVATRSGASGLTLRLSRDPGDLERFERELYRPMLARRHGDMALRTGHALLRLGQRRGGLFIAEKDGRALSAAVGAPSVTTPGDLEIWALGVAEGAPPPASLAPVLGWARWARERRFVALDHLVSLPLYSDGLTRHKLRWGTVISEPTETSELIALRVHGESAALASWLGRHTFAACGRSGLVRVDAPDAGSLAGIARALAET